MIKKILVVELGPIYLCIASVVLIILLIGLGLIHLVCKSIYHTFQVKFWKGPIYFITYWLKVLYQLWNCIKYLLIEIAISLDLFGNISCGEAIEDCVTAKEDTLYGRGDITISAATGELEMNGNLNTFGWKFTSTLSKVLGENHSINCYKNYLDSLTKTKG